MSNILKPSGYQFNARNGARGYYGDVISVSKEFGPIDGEDPTNVIYLFNCWVNFDLVIADSFEGKQLLFNFGNKFYCYLETEIANGIRAVCGFWTYDEESPAPYPIAFHTFYTDWLNPIEPGWHQWSVVISGAHDKGAEDIDFRFDTEKMTVNESLDSLNTLVSEPGTVWTVSSEGTLPLSTQDGFTFFYERCSLFAQISEVSIFVKESLDASTIIDYLYSQGASADANGYLSFGDGSRLGAYLPLLDGWMNTKSPGKGRHYFDSDGFVGIGKFGATPNTTKRIFSVPGNGNKVLSDRELYLSHTRSNDKFVAKAIPEFDHQIAWINRSVSVTDFPDAEGL